MKVSADQAIISAGGDAPSAVRARRVLNTAEAGLRNHEQARRPTPDGVYAAFMPERLNPDRAFTPPKAKFGCVTTKAH